MQYNYSVCSIDGSHRSSYVSGRHAAFHDRYALSDRIEQGLVSHKRKRSIMCFDEERYQGSRSLSSREFRGCHQEAWMLSLLGCKCHRERTAGRIMFDAQYRNTHNNGNEERNMGYANARTSLQRQDMVEKLGDSSAIER